MSDTKVQEYPSYYTEVYLRISIILTQYIYLTLLMAYRSFSSCFSPRKWSILSITRLNHIRMKLGSDQEVILTMILQVYVVLVVVVVKVMTSCCPSCSRICYTDFLLNKDKNLFSFHGALAMRMQEMWECLMTTSFHNNFS